MVMVDDDHLRANRLALLQTLVKEFSTIADFSEIVTEGKESTKCGRIEKRIDMATTTLPDTEIMETKTHDAQNMFTSSAAARPMATAR